MAVIHMLSGDGITPGALTGTATGYDFMKQFGLGTFTYKGKALDCLYMNGTGISIDLATTWLDMGVLFRMDSAATTARMYYSVPVNDPIFDEDRTGKWYIHVMIRAGGYGPTANNYVTINYRDAAGTDRVYNASASFVNSGTVPVETIIDWDAMTISVYRLSTLVTTFAFTEITGPINMGYCSRVATNTGGWSGINHMYFVIDRGDDPTPTGRLGPCYVLAEPLTVYSSLGDPNPADPTAGLPVLNAFAPNTALTGSTVYTDTRSQRLTVGVNPNSVKEAIAAQITVMTFKDSASIVNTNAQLDMPGSLPMSVETPVTSIDGSLSFVINQDVDGNPLSSAGQIPMISIWSKP